jgi:uncharacterized membrane protein
MSNINGVAGPIEYFQLKKLENSRLGSIDLLRGLVMIIMALDHVRDFFHKDAFLYSPTDLTQTNGLLFFTRWITHFCAPVFVFLAGISAYLYGVKRSKKELSFYLLTRGVSLVLMELFIIGIIRTFNPTFSYIHLQVIWAIGICMIILSAMIYLNWRLLMLVGILIIALHNLLDPVQVTGNNFPSFLWAILHQAKYFYFSYFTVYAHYPVLPWLGVMIVGFSLGKLFTSDFERLKRRKILLYSGLSAIVLFIFLRSGNFYGDAAAWSVQKNSITSLMSFLNVTKYPPSLLYILMTLGPALIFLAIFEKIRGALAEKIIIFGRVPMFYYMAHLLLIHIFAVIGALITGYGKYMLFLPNSVYEIPELKGYGFSLLVVYMVWAGLVLLLYPFCKSYALYKRSNQSTHKWLSYL